MVIMILVSAFLTLLLLIVIVWCVYACLSYAYELHMDKVFDKKKNFVQSSKTEELDISYAAFDAKMAHDYKVASDVLKGRKWL